MMSDKMMIVCLSLFFFAGTIVGYHYGELPKKEAVEECQKTLPRNVECVIVAVPETEIGDE